MADTTVTLGAFTFRASALQIGALPRAIGLSANALARYPVQTTDYIGGYRQITVSGFLRGIETQDETAGEHLVRQVSNLRTELAKDTNTLTVAWSGVGTPEVYTVHKNEDLSITYESHLDSTHLVAFEVTLNCLP